MIWVIIILVLVIVWILTVCFLKGSHNKELDELEQDYERQIFEEQNKKVVADEKKESIQTGNNRNDFNNGINIVQDIANRGKSNNSTDSAKSSSK